MLKNTFKNLIAERASLTKEIHTMTKLLPEDTKDLNPELHHLSRMHQDPNRHIEFNPD